MSHSKQSPVRKSLNDVKVKYSPAKKQNNKYNNVFVRGYKFGLMTLEFKKFSFSKDQKIQKKYILKAKEKVCKIFTKERS